MQNFLLKFIFLITCVVSVTYLSSQNEKDFKYRRSSISMILLETDNYPNKNIVLNSWNNYPFPDKYNKHEVPYKSFNVNNTILTDNDLLASGFLRDTLKTLGQILKASTKPLNYLNADKTIAVVMPTEAETYQLKIDKFIRENKLANELIAKWFNRNAEGKFDMSLIQERGFYNASELEAGIAKGQTRGIASLGDAGEELIKNTFVTFTKLEFYENEPVARAIRDAAKEETLKQLAGKSQIAIDLALAALDVAYDKAKEGYSLWSKTWLYRLAWNDSIAAVFYSDLWNGTPEAFNNSDLFKLEFVGSQFNQSLVTFKLGTQRTEEQIIDLALVRNIDNAFQKLQRQNEVFKPKVPVISTEPITAQIGMKEGLKGGEKFQVLEMTLNPKTGLTEYKKVTTVKVIKKYIWDNRYNAGGKPEKEILDKNGTPIVATQFKGSKKVEQGMLLKQIK